jgi:integrase
MDNPYRMKTVVMDGGERLPMLLRRADGMPLFDPAVYALTQVRGRSQSSATIERHIRAVMQLLAFAEAEGIDLDERIWTGRLLTMNELDALAEAAARPIETLVERLAERQAATRPPKVPVRPASIERYRARLKSEAPPSVVADSTGTRLRIMRDYITWLASRQIGALTDDKDIAIRRMTLDSVISGLNARVPAKRGSNGRLLPEGLSTDQITRLLEIIAPDSVANPWRDPKARIRNELIVQWFYRLGIRRGELLAVRVSDMKGASSDVVIERRPDSADDPRIRQPLVKTRGRSLPMASLFQSTQKYILEIRTKLPGAIQHPFLFVDVRSGRPLSHSGLTKVFEDLSGALGFNVAAHLLRHSWNDAFSAEMDRKKVPEATEKKVRSYLQGWNETSNTAAIYTRRHVRETAEKIMLQMQKEIFHGKTHGRTDEPE